MFDFDRFSELNRKRSRTCYPCKDWTLLEWGGALSGEVGELCNKLKKIRTGRKVEREELAEEIADIVIYLDLLSEQLGIDIPTAVTEKLNRVSGLVGFKEEL